MRSTRYITSVVVLFSLIATVIPAAAGGHSPSSSGKPAGCHKHTTPAPTPDPTPMNYACCKTGHDSAVLPTDRLILSSLECISLAEDLVPKLLQTHLVCARDLRLPDADPPGLLVLRI